MQDEDLEKIPHYYGDTVRILFLVSAIIMLLGLPSLSNYLAVPTLISVVSILILGLAAGLTNPQLLWDAGINALISSIGFVVFETYAVMAYQKYSAVDRFFLANLILGLVFMIALYFSVKTVRGLILQGKG